MRYLVLIAMITILMMFICQKLLCDDITKRSMEAYRTNDKIIIDGIIDSSWDTTNWSFSGFFIQNEPNAGKTDNYKTEVKILYDNFSFYILAKIHEKDAFSIPKELGNRDSHGETNSDAFGISFDTYNNGQNAFAFIVSASNVQTDIFITPQSEEYTWSVVWRSNVKIYEDYWVMEMKIPHSSIRFSKQKEQIWGINCLRLSKKRNEKSFWNFVDPSIKGFVNQFGTLQNIRNIKSPIRLSANPYLSAYYIVDDANNISRPNITGGLDLKFGINESYTVDMVLIPDFGQVRSDNIVLNLNAFEVQYQENRPFFTEGTDIFNLDDLFYSRRIGGTYHSILGNYNEDTDSVLSRSSESPLINATKISGRNKNGLGLGILNSITQRTYAELVTTKTQETRKVLADPLTNYNVIVIDKNLKNNSNISFTNISTIRSDGGDNANMTGGFFRFNDKKNINALNGSVAMSQKFVKNENNNYTNNTGFRYKLFLGKVSGKWQYNIEQLIESDNYDPNDLGFLESANEISHRVRVSYNIFKPIGNILQFSQRLGSRYTLLYRPLGYSEYVIWGSTRFRFKNFWNLNIFYVGRPVTNKDFFEPRHEGYYFSRLPSGRINAFISTDSRKKILVELNQGVWSRPGWNQIDNWHDLWIRYRFSNKFSFSYGLENITIRKERGYATSTYNENDEVENIIFGIRNRKIIENSIESTYIFNPMTNITLLLRHYWAVVNYSPEQFHTLQENGNLEIYPSYYDIDEEYKIDNTTNFNIFSVDLSFSWLFLPGSTINIVWKNNIQEEYYEDNRSFIENFRKTIESDQRNSFSIRIVYFLDYLDVKKAFNKR